MFDGESLIIKYQISAMPEPRTATAGNVFAETVDTSFTFEGLVNGITYKFQVNAVSDIGPGILSEIITGTPLSSYIPTPAPITTSEKTTVCHNDKITLHLPRQAVRAHLENYDDYLGECSDNSSISNEKAKQLQREADKVQKESILEAKNIQNNLKKDK